VTRGRRSCCPLIARRRDSRCRRRHLFFGFHVPEAETANLFFERMRGRRSCCPLIARRRDSRCRRL
jgi:hypothetical protein